MNDLYFGPLESTIPKWAEKYYNVDQDSETSTIEDIFMAKCGAYRDYTKNVPVCDDMAALNPTKELRVKACHENMYGTDPTKRYFGVWCSMYAGLPQNTKKDEIFPEYASCILPNGKGDMTQPKCAQACKGRPIQKGCKLTLTERPVKIYKPAEVTFNEQCGPFPFIKYRNNVDKCDALVAARPDREFRMNMCAAALANPAASNPARWCSMYPGDNQATGTVLPEYARCIKPDGMVDMTRARCANVCKGKPGQNGCPGRPLAAK